MSWPFTSLSNARCPTWLVHAPRSSDKCQRKSTPKTTPKLPKMNTQTSSNAFHDRRPMLLLLYNHVFISSYQLHSDQGAQRLPALRPCPDPAKRMIQKLRLEYSRVSGVIWLPMDKEVRTIQCANLREKEREREREGGTDSVPSTSIPKHQNQRENGTNRLC